MLLKNHKVYKKLPTFSILIILLSLSGCLNQENNFSLKEKCKEYQNQEQKRYENVFYYEPQRLKWLRYSKSNNSCIAKWEIWERNSLRMHYEYWDVLTNNYIKNIENLRYATEDTVSVKKGEGFSDSTAIEEEAKNYEKTLELIK